MNTMSHNCWDVTPSEVQPSFQGPATHSLGVRTHKGEPFVFSVLFSILLGSERVGTQNLQEEEKLNVPPGGRHLYSRLNSRLGNSPGETFPCTDKVRPLPPSLSENLNHLTL